MIDYIIQTKRSLDTCWKDLESNLTMEGASEWCNKLNQTAERHGTPGNYYISQYRVVRREIKDTVVSLEKP